DAFIERIADTQRLHARTQLRNQLFSDTFLYQDARAGAAYLPLVEPDRIDHTFDDAVEIRVIKHDEGRLATEFERQLLAGACRRRADPAPYVGGCGERDLVDVRRLDECCPGVAVSRYDVDNASRQADLIAKLGEAKCGERRVLRGLE